jgi:RNA polymerase sigma factor (sigma-70 family)
MEKGPARSALRQIRTLFAHGTLGGLTDAQLLERFLTRAGDDADDAFAALVHHHGPMVLGVCRRMLPGVQDAEDAFQATFLVLARRAASIGRREQLASWLYGVAVRTAKEAKRTAARRLARERQIMDASRVEFEPTEDRIDELAILDEELNRLPERYRVALVTCEIGGKSRREAAGLLGLPEGTLSAHLARGRKLLRERLLRRGVTMGVGPVAAWSRPVAEAAIPERLMDSTVQAALGYVSGVEAVGTVPATVASLAGRVLKMIFLTRLSVFLASLLVAGGGLVAIFVLVSMALVVGPPNLVADEPRPAAIDLTGRVVDRAGVGLAQAQVWVIGGAWDKPETVATAMTDRQGRFTLPHHLEEQVAKGASSADRIRFFARARDGRTGWLATVWRNSADGRDIEIEIGPVGEVRGRVTDQNGRPIAGAAVATATLSGALAAGQGGYIGLSAEVAAPYRATTAADGSFLLEGIPQGARVEATITAQGFGAPRFAWDSTQSVTIALDHRVGRIQGSLKLPDGRGLSGPVWIRLQRSAAPDTPASSAHQVFSMAVAAGKNGAFQFDGLPPGRYTVEGPFAQNSPFAFQPVENIEVGPNAVAKVQIPIERLVTITGRVVDARTGDAIAGISLHCYQLKEGMYLHSIATAQTGQDGHYSLAAQPGSITIRPERVPKTYRLPYPSESPTLEVKADRAWPDLKLAPATALDGLVVDPSGQPVAGADVFLLETEGNWSRRPNERVRTGLDGTFHIDQLDPDERLSLWARTRDATTDGVVVVCPGDVKGKLTLTIDPQLAFRIGGTATASDGKKLAGAKVMLWWTRPYATTQARMKGMSTSSVLETYSTDADGAFDFQGLWPKVDYKIVVQARGHTEAEMPGITGRPGQAQNLGALVLIDTTGHIAGRVVDSDGRPVSGAAVFNHGDASEPVAASTDAQGRFRLEGLLPGTKYAFVRKEGYRFTGVRTDGDADDLSVQLLKTTEPPPAWNPAATASFDEQRWFARRVLIRLWEKYGAGANQNGAFVCILDMAPIDLAMALEWSAQDGHRYDASVRESAAMELADTDARAALALLNGDNSRGSHQTVQQLADRFAATDVAKAMLFAEAAAVRARGLNLPERAPAMAQAGAVLARLGRAEAGRALIDEAAEAAAQLGTEKRPAYQRALVARALAPFDLERALALIEPTRGERSEKVAYLALVAGAIATTDARRAVAMAETMEGPTFHQEEVKTEIAYKIGAERPDEAIRIIEGMKRDPSTRWQAEAFGWLAVALAPRDRARAFALIDRALALLIDDPDPYDRSSSSGAETAAAAHVAACARRIGYPDMESVIMRVMATRRGQTRGNAVAQIRSATVAAVPLALIDPGAARTILEQIDARGGLDPSTLPNARDPWQTAWALVDLDRAEALFDAELAALEGTENVDLQRTSFFHMVRMLATPPGRREAAARRYPFGSSWQPGD